VSWIIRPSVISIERIRLSSPSIERIDSCEFIIYPGYLLRNSTISIGLEFDICQARVFIHLKCYRKADKDAKGKLLDEMETVTELHRKSLIRLMGSSIQRKQSKRQRGSAYGPQVEHALRVISKSLDHICAERLQPNLVWIAQHLAHHGELETSSDLLNKLEKISVSTVRRLLKRAPRDPPRNGPERANRLAREIPARRIPWQEQEPGHFETDLVHHCGASASGDTTSTLCI